MTILWKVRASSPISSLRLSVNVVLEVAGIADAARHIHQVGQGFGDGFGGAVGDRDAQR